MLGGLFLAVKAQNLFIDVSPGAARYIKGSRLSFTGAIGLTNPNADINESRSTFDLSGNGGAPIPLPYFAIHEIYGISSGGGGGGSSDWHRSESGEGGGAGHAYSVLAKLFAPVMKSLGCISIEGGSAGVNHTNDNSRAAGGNGITSFATAFLFSTKTPVVNGVGGRKWMTGLQLDYRGQKPSVPPMGGPGGAGDGGTGGIGNTSLPADGRAGFALCRGLVW